ncbi:MAG: SpoIIE family protein phosphatase [Pseudonocardia sp.]|uniref:PP2C family protein-serine/threonine phosphatase n=1 Tax=unclassified Pseudonocardia TaxID=2619320 RepID=UPI001AC40CA3|nr:MULTISPECIES: GAF domain-containing SpoIIE family protein phosphatase [unclassified Pseudonocardia]MBN9107253.1 SpoIIE family protein phosphatase [Pseudonocardia sp.]
MTTTNRLARGLLPAAEVGGLLDAVAPQWLVDAHAAVPRRAVTDADRSGAAHTVAGPVPSETGPRWVEAYARPDADGAVTWWLVDVTDLRTTREALRTEQARAAFLAEVSSRLLGSLNVQRCMEITAELATAHLCDAALVIAPARRGRHATVVSVRGRGTTLGDLTGDPAEVAGLAEALQGFPPVPSRWLDPAAAPEWLVPPGVGRIGSVVVTPLPGHGVPAGALVLLRTAGADGEGVFAEDEEMFSRLFAVRAGNAMSAARLYDQQASITETLMRELLPPVVQQLDGVEFAARYRPSQDEERIGGDFYDVHPGIDGDGSLVVLGDVCGKGLDAAVLTGKIRSGLRALLPFAGDHLRVLQLLNSALLDADDTRFATLVLATVRRDAAGACLRLTCGGHPAPLVVRADGTVEEVDSAGTLVGALPEVVATTADVRLGAGETCLLYTDGITEARGGPFGDEQFGEERLRRALSQCAGMPAEAVVERVQMLASEWIGRGVHDDMAVFAVTVPRGQHLTAVGGHGRGRYTA